MKRVIEWILWDRTHLAIAAVSGFVLLMGGLTVFGGAPETEAAAETPTASSTPTPTGIPHVDVGEPKPLPPVVTPSSVPAPTITLPGSGADDPATAEGMADRFMRAWLAVRESDRAQWEADLNAMASGAQMRETIHNIPESMIPNARVVNSIQESTTTGTATVGVQITNGDVYTVILHSDSEGVWRVVSADPYGGGE